MLPPAPVSPWRYTCIAYADIDTVYLVFPSSPPRALFFVVTVEVIPSGRNPLPGIFKLSKHEIAHQTRGIESPDRLLQPSAITYIRIWFSLVPGILSCILSFPTRDLPESLQFGLPLVIVGYSRYCAYSRYCVYSRYRWPTLISEIRDITRVGCAGIPRFFPSFSRIL